MCNRVSGKMKTWWENLGKPQSYSVPVVFRARSSRSNPGCESCEWYDKMPDSEYENEIENGMIPDPGKCKKPENLTVRKRWWGDWVECMSKPWDQNDDRKCPWFEPKGETDA